MFPRRNRPKPQKKRDFQHPKVVFQPETLEGMQAGIDQLVRLVRPTLGPLPHAVAVEKIAGRSDLPELLDSAGTIARRVIQIRDRDEDVGFMYLRHVLWKLQETEGDGTATAAILFQSIYHQANRYIVAGGNPMVLRDHFEKGLRILLEALDRQTTRLHGKQALTGLARTICYDDDMAKMLGEIFDIVGAYGRLEVRKGSGRELTREYVEGMYWDSGMRSRQMGNADAGLRANLENPSILISDLEIENPEQLVPLLDLAIKNNIKQLLLVSSTLSEKAMGLLLAKPNQERVFVVAVKTPGMSSTVQRDAMEDLAILTGGRALIKASGDTLEKVQLEDLGGARRAWADSEYFGIIGGKGDPRVLRKHIATLRALFRDAVPSLTPKEASEAQERSQLLQRLGKLTGGSGTLFVGALSPNAIDARVELAKRAAEAMRGAMREGVVPGGGVALLNCRAALRACLKAAPGSDERATYEILLRALETPFRAILENAGLRSGALLDQVDRLGPGYGYDVLAGKVARMDEAGLYDAAPVVKGALRSAVSGAMLAITTEAIIHRKNPPEGLQT